MQYKYIFICVQTLFTLFQYANSESLQCYVCTDCQTNFEDTVQTCLDDNVLTTSQQPDITTTEGYDVTTTDPTATTTSTVDDGSDISSQTTTSEPIETTDNPTSTLGIEGTTTPIEEETPPDNDGTTTPEVQNNTPTDIDVHNEPTNLAEITAPPSIDLTMSENSKTSMENNNAQLSDTSDKSSTLKDTDTSNDNNKEVIIQEPPTMFTSDVHDTSTLGEISERQTFTTPDIINVQTTPSADLDTNTITINTEYPVEPIDDSTTISPNGETAALSDIEDIRVGEQLNSKVKIDQQPNVQMVNDSNKYGSRYAFIRTIREVKNDVQRIPRCVVTSYTEENRTVVVRGCSFVEDDDPMKHCNSLMAEGNEINLTRCMVCDQNRCNGATKTMAGLMIIIVAIMTSF